MASSTIGPITPTDQQVHERAIRVVYHGLEHLEKQLTGKEPINYEKLGAVAAAVQAGTEAMLPPGDKDEDDGDY